MERIGKYQIQKVLGHGGMGTVYEAIDPLINRRVALKTMIAGLTEKPELRARFMREAQAAGGLRHRNIVTVYDLGEDKGTPYIAMELVEGQDLEKIVQDREPRSAEWKVGVLRQVCEGLGYAHRAGIVHRDVKPGNIRVTPEGEVKIMDFGIAHLQSSTITKGGGLAMGTVHYMAPEQIDGGAIDQRADIFAVGAIAYELLAYRRPFDGESMPSVMYKITHEQADLGALPRTEYSPGLEAVIARALQRAPADRYQTLDEMRADLDRLVAGPAVPAAPAPEGDAELREMRAEVERARAEGQLQKALGACHKMLEHAPGDPEGARLLAEVEALIQDREVEQLCALALSYATDGDMDLALKIAARIERLAAQSARLVQLKSYLHDEAARRAAAALTASAQEHLVLGNLEEARAAAEEALESDPSHAVAREIRDRASSVLQAQHSAAERQRDAHAPPPAPPPAAPAPAPPAQRAPEVLSLPDLDDLVAHIQPAAAPALPAAPPAAEPPPVAAPPPPAPAPAAAPVAAAPAAAAAPAMDPRVEAATLATSAMNHFMTNSYPKAKKAALKALALDPSNKRAQELMKILSSLS